MIGHQGDVSVIVNPAPHLDAVAVHIVRYAFGRGYVLRFAGGEWTETLIEERARLPEDAAIVFPAGVWRALGAAAAETLPPDAAVDRHLKDAIDVRDRLLELVARGVRSAK